MSRSFRALLWEQWQQSWILVIPWIGCTLLFAGANLMMLGLGHDPGELLAFWGWGMGLMLLPLLFMSGTARDIRLDFPRRLFSLPCSSTTLFFAQWTYKALVGAALGGSLCLLNWSWMSKMHAWWMPSLFFITAVSYGQLGACLATALGAWRGALLFLVPLLLALMFQASVLDWLIPGVDDEDAKVVAGLVVAVASTLLGWWVTVRMRSGSLAQFKGGLWSGEFARKPGDYRRFPSPAAAQRWFEWQNSARYGAVISLAIVGLSFVFALIYPKTMFIEMFFSGMVLPAVSFGTGFYLTRATPRYAGLVFTKPINSAALARAKLATGLRYAGIVAGVIILVSVIMSLELRHAGNDVEFAVGYFLALSLGVFAMLMMGREALLVSTVSYLASLPLLALFYYEHDQFGVDDVSLVIQGGAVLLCLMLVVWDQSRKRQWNCRHYLPWLIGVAVLTFTVLLNIHASQGEMDRAQLLPAQMALTMLVAGLFAEVRVRQLTARRFLNHPMVVFAALVVLWAALDVVVEEWRLEEELVTALRFFFVAPALAAFAWVPLMTAWQRNR